MNRFIGRSRRIGAGLLVLGVLFVTSGFSLAALAAPGNGNNNGNGNGNGNGGGDHIEICHFQGQIGSGVFVTLTVSANSNGHFGNNGTQEAGHEADYLGPCVGDEVNETEDTTPTTTEDTTPTTTEDTTPTTTEDTTPTTTEDTTPTTVAIDSETLAENSEDDESTTTSTVGEVEDDDTLVVATGGESTTPSAPAAQSAEAEVEVETLPYTGPTTYLIVPGMILLLVGAFAVFMSNGFGASGGTHVANEQARISVGMHRGRHEG
jgi:hypothetical protein